jgi:hypothetical protein
MSANPMTTASNPLVNLFHLDHRLQQQLIEQADRFEFITELTNEALRQMGNIALAGEYHTFNAAMMRAAIEQMMQAAMTDEDQLHSLLMWRHFREQMAAVTENGMEEISRQHAKSVSKGGGRSWF